MHAVPARTGGVSTVVLAITMGFALLGNFASALMSQCEPFLVLGLMLLIGLPHGATDHGLFLALTKERSFSKKVNFYLIYALVIGTYAALWYLLPLLAFIIFMLLSVYHFGQSNWADIDYGQQQLGRFHYLIWGTGILLTPILLYGQEAATIVADMTSTMLVVPSSSSILVFISSMAIANLVFLLFCWRRKIICGRRVLKEILGYALLLGMFFTNSLLLGFTVYFVFWHSLASAKDQFQFFQHRLSPAVRKQLYLGIITTVGGALAFCLIVWFGPGPEAALLPGIIGSVFIFISLLTLPHMLLVEGLYTHWSPASKQEKTLQQPKLNNQDQIHTRIVN